MAFDAANGQADLGAGWPDLVRPMTGTMDAEDAAVVFGQPGVFGAAGGGGGPPAAGTYVPGHRREDGPRKRWLT